jgi:hypothetical protein
VHTGYRDLLLALWIFLLVAALVAFAVGGYLLSQATSAEGLSGAPQLATAGVAGSVGVLALSGWFSTMLAWITVKALWVSDRPRQSR